MGQSRFEELRATSGEEGIESLIKSGVLTILEDDASGVNRYELWEQGTDGVTGEEALALSDSIDMFTNPKAVLERADNGLPYLRLSGEVLAQVNGVLSRVSVEPGQVVDMFGEGARFPDPSEERA